MNYVIIGGGIAAVSCLHQLYTILKQHTVQSHITVLTQSNILKYINKYTKLTEHLNTYEINEATTTTLLQQFTDTNNVSIQIIPCTVQSIHINNNTVHTTNGEHKYDKLCICSGSSPINIFTQYTNTSIQRYIHTIRDTDSISTVTQRIQHCNTIAVCGNGGIALELIYLLLQQQLYNTTTPIHIVWCIRNQYIGNTFFTQHSAKFMIDRLLQLLHKQPIVHYNNNNNNTVHNKIHNTVNTATTLSAAGAGPNWLYELTNKDRTYGNVQLYDHIKQQYIDSDTIQLHNNVTLTIELNNEIIDLTETNTQQLQMTLSNDVQYTTDILISATGVQSNTQFIPNTIHTNTQHDILVDANMCTNINNVYAAGDCVGCEQWELQGEHKNWHHMKLWSHAYIMGQVAAKSMCDIVEQYNSNFILFTHMTSFFGLNVILLGHYNAMPSSNAADYYDYMKSDTANNKFIHVILSKHTNTIIGCTLIGNTELEETYENLMISETDMTQFGDFVNSGIELDEYFD